MLAAFDAAAEGLGNTRAVCRKYYVHPILIEKYEDSSIATYFDLLDSDGLKLKDHFSPTETVLLKMLSEYEIVLA